MPLHMGSNIICPIEIKPFINLTYASVLENEFKNRLVEQDFPYTVAMFIKCRLFNADYCSENDSNDNTLGRLI